MTTWLHRVVVNACLDRLRRQQTRTREQPLPADPDRAAALGTRDRRGPVGTQEARVDVERGSGATQRRPAGRAGAGRHGGVSVEEAADHPGLRARHGEEPLRPRPGAGSGRSWRTWRSRSEREDER